MKKLTKAIMLSAVLGASVMAAIPAQAWWGGGPWDRGGWGPWDRGGWGGPWGGRDSYDDWDWGPWDGNGWGDATFSISGGGRGYGRGYGHNRYRDYDSWGPWGGYGPGYGGGPYGYGPRYGDDYYGDYDRPRRRPSRDDAPPPEGPEGGKK